MTKLTPRPKASYFYPAPAVLVSCGTGQQANIITIAWTAMLCSEPPHVGVSVQPRRYSYELIKDLGEFVVNLPTADQVKWLDYCGNVSGSEVDKWSACGFSKAPAKEIRVPLIAECPVNLECRVKHTIPLGMHDLFIGEVVTVHVDEEVLDKSERVDPAKAKPFVYLPGGGGYWQIGEYLGEAGFSVKEGG